MGWSFKKNVVDPVCGKRINPVKSGIAAIHDGSAYYFCSARCWEAFQGAPTHYSHIKLPTPKGWWERYRRRVDKATQGKPPCCH